MISINKNGYEQYALVGTIVEVVESHRLGEQPNYKIGTQNVEDGHVFNKVVFNRVGKCRVTSVHKNTLHLHHV